MKAYFKMIEIEHSQHDLSVENNGGLLLRTIRHGQGDDVPCYGDRVFILYEARLLDETVVDKRKDGSPPFQFTIGKREVIRGLDIAVGQMHRGEVAVITCKPDYAYGTVGVPPHVPPHSAVIFEIELINWKTIDLPVTKDGGITKRVIKQGSKPSLPNNGSIVTIQYAGFHDGVQFVKREVTFTLGEGCEDGVISGLEYPSRKMRKGERCRLTISPRYAYGQKGCPSLGVPSNATLVYEVEMVAFVKAKEPWEMDAGQKLEQSRYLKANGTKFFQKGNHSKALENFQKIVTFLEPETSGLVGSESTERVELLVASLANTALCCLKIGMWNMAEEACNKTLVLDPQNVKCLYRRGQSFLERSQFADADRDFKAVLELEPNNSVARRQLCLVQRRRKEALKEERQLCEKLFTNVKSTSGSDYRKESSSMPEIDHWHNDLASGMMSLQDEHDAFEDIVDVVDAGS